MKSISGARWAYSSQLIRLVSQIIGLYVMTRLTKPSDYGLFSLVGVVSNFALLFRDIGAGALIIKSKKLSQKNLNFLFASSLIVGFLSLAATVLFAFFADNFFNVSGLKNLLLVVSFVFPIVSSCVVPQALMEKKINFSFLARVEIFSILLGTVIGMVWAIFYPSPWCFLCPFFLSSILSAIFIWGKSDWCPSLVADGVSIPDGVSSVKKITAFNIINYFYRNVDVMLVGKLFGPVALAGYSLSYRLMTMPLQLFGSAISRVSYPKMAEMNNSGTDIRIFYFNIFKSIIVLSLFPMTGLFIFREFVDIRIFGGRFYNVSLMIAFMCPVGVMQAAMSTTGSVLMVLDKEWVMLKNGVANLLIMSVSFFVAAHFSVVVFAALLLLSTGISFFVCFYQTVGSINGVFVEYVKVFIKAICFFPLIMIIEKINLIFFNLNSVNNIFTIIFSWTLIIYFFKNDMSLIKKFFKR